MTPSSSAPAAADASTPPGTLRATRWRTHKYGDIDNLKQESYDVPPPGPQEVRIRVRAAGLNFADVFAVLGLYSYAGDAPFTPGFDVSGTVDAVGSAVSEFAVGDHVSALTLFGGYASALNVRATRTRRLPDGWSFADGAAWSTQAFTAWYALCELAGFRGGSDGMADERTRGRRVLIHSAAGGVGLRLVDIAQRLGMDAVCVVGREEKRAVLLERGVPDDRVLLRPSGRGAATRFEQMVRDAGGEIDVVVDSVAGDLFQAGWNLLRARGHDIVIGSAALMPGDGLTLSGPARLVSLLRLAWGYVTRPRVDVINGINQNKSVHMFNLGGLFDDDELLRRGFEELDRLEVGKALIGRRMDFDRAGDALRFLQSGRSVGKIVLELGEPDESKA